MPACSRTKCIALASAGGLCSLHAAGYDKHDGLSEISCDNCRRLVLKDEWYRRQGASVLHTKGCKAHPETLKERKKATA